jgi:L-amino acid N-acyltransferase YncA
MIRIRHAAQADAEAIAEIYVETWRSTYAGILPDHVLINMSAERQMIYWTRAIRNDWETILIAEEMDGAVVAVGSAGPNRDRTSAHAGEVYTLYVHPDHQERGIGEKLLANLFYEIMAQGINSVVIWVLAPNPARFFYEAMGGVRAGDRDEKLWGTTLKEIAYVWNDLNANLASGRPRIDRDTA